MYDLFLIGAAAKFRILFADQGLAIFSRVMVINTLLCSLLSVVAARTLRRPISPDREG